MTPLLSVSGLRTEFRTDTAQFAAVDGISFDLSRGEALGVVGESGCGKSVTALSLLRLVQDPPGRITGGRILFEDRDLLGLDDAAMRDIRGNRIGMIFQEPMTSLNPVFAVGGQISEAYRIHRRASRAEARRRAIEMLEQVGIPAPVERVDSYPHQLSGGMRQRVMIAMALVCDPSLLIADEPTTALDVTIQAQILDLLRGLRQRHAMSLLLITHDLGVVAETCDRVIVMYAGRIVEEAPVAEIFRAPRHPYTVGLLRSVPAFEAVGDGRARPTERPRLETIRGTVPPPYALPSGCRFRDRCDSAQADCAAKDPVLVPMGTARHRAACWHPAGSP